ncbi:MAG: hypothetical protein WAM42_11575 [Candidatus Nitrosopolaris sp.]|jgi:hypothetical protein
MHYKNLKEQMEKLKYNEKHTNSSARVIRSNLQLLQYLLPLLLGEKG